MPKLYIYTTKTIITESFDNAVKMPFDVLVFLETEAEKQNYSMFSMHLHADGQMINKDKIITETVERAEDLFVTYISFSKVYTDNKDLESLKIYGGYDSDEKVAKQKCIDLIKAQCDVDVDINDVVVIKK